MTEFDAVQVEKTDAGVTHQVVRKTVDDLPAGDVVIKVSFSSVNYKDAMSARGLPCVTRPYPHARRRGRGFVNRSKFQGG
ncbi:MAG: hypothetical protein P8J55_13990 [Pseudomonadales bacterium]|nr:hypothetical protein [Pseudomonadales bacterium]